MISDKTFESMGFRAYQVQVYGRDVRTHGSDAYETKWIKRLGDVLYASVDKNGFVELSTKAEFKKRTDTVIIPKPCRTTAELNKLLDVLMLRRE